MPTDLFTQVNYNVGEGLANSDLANMAKFADSRLLDQMYSRLVGALGATALDPSITSENGENPALTSLIYTLTGGEAVLKVGSTATRVSLTSGTIFQKIGNVTGLDANFLSYLVDESDVDLVISAGDATNPRIDILQVKLEYVTGGAENRDIEDSFTKIVTAQSVNKTRRVQATFSLKQGTPAATPTYPAPDTGYAVIGSLYVPATWTTGVVPDPDVGASGSARLRQCSLPLRVRTVRTPMTMMFKGGASTWSNATTPPLWLASGGAATALMAPCPAGYESRVVGIGLVAKFVTSGAVQLRLASHTTLGPSFITGPVFNMSSVLVNADGNFRYYFAHLGNIASSSNDSTPVSTVVGDAFWASGGKAGPAQRPNVLNTPPYTAVNVEQNTYLTIDGGTNSQVAEVIWFLAG